MENGATDDDRVMVINGLTDVNEITSGLVLMRPEAFERLEYKIMARMSQFSPDVGPLARLVVNASNLIRSYIQESAFEERQKSAAKAFNLLVEYESRCSKMSQNIGMQVAQLSDWAARMKKSILDDYKKCAAHALELRLELIDPFGEEEGSRVRLRMRLRSESPKNAPIARFWVSTDGIFSECYNLSNAEKDEGSEFVLMFDPPPDALAERYGEVRVNISYVKELVPDLLEEDNLKIERGEWSGVVRYLLHPTESLLPEFKNPFLSRQKASGDVFVGRKQEVEEILALFRPGVSQLQFAVYGQHYCGKSSLLERVEVLLKEERIDGHAAFEYTFVDGQYLASRGYELEFLRSLVRQIGIGRDGELSREECLNAVWTHARQLTAMNMTWIVALDEFTKPYAEYCECRDAQSDASGAHDRMLELRSYLELLRSLVGGGAFNLLAVGQQDMCELMDDISFVNAVSRFRVMPLGYLNKIDIRRLALLPEQKGLVKGGFYRQNTLDRITELAGDHPMLAQLILEELFSMVKRLRFPVVVEALLDRVVKCLVEDGEIGHKLRWGDFEPFYCLRKPCFKEVELKAFYGDYIRNSKCACWVRRDVLEHGDIHRQKLIDLLCSRGVLLECPGKIRLRFEIFDRWLRKNEQHLRV